VVTGGPQVSEGEEGKAATPPKPAFRRRRLSAAFIAVGGSLRTGMALALLTIAIEALAVLPGRIALGRDQEQYGRSPTEFIVAGMFRDLSDLALPIGIVIATALAIAMLLRHRKSDSILRSTILRFLTICLSAIGILVWFTSAAAAEFKIQRGVDATWFDVELASKSSQVMWSSLGFIFMRRHWLPAVVAFGAGCILLFHVRKRSRGWAMSQRALVLVGFVVTTAASFGLALVPLDPHVRIFRTIADRHIVGEPFVNLFAHLGRSQENVQLGMKGLITQARFPATTERGEPLLGLPTTSAIDCNMHPMARAFPVGGAEPSYFGAGHHAIDPETVHVLELFDQLSKELHAPLPTASSSTAASASGVGRTIDVWQVMMESFRADDVHAIAPSAPREVAPFMNGLYESAARSLGSVIAVQRMWQAGARTSQGFSSYLCGLGMLPFGLSVTRDFGPVPVRCLPDVLSDAKIDSAFFFGGNPSFDEMDTFLRHHGMHEIVGRLQQPLSSPTGEGGVSDRALVAHAAEHVAKSNSGSGSGSSGDHAGSSIGGHYYLVMMGSNHIPYRRPDDLPAEIDERVNALQQTDAFVGTPDDASRLRTFAYADLAVSELVQKHLAPNLSRSVFVVGADHATGDPFAWKTEDRNLFASHALIPFAIMLPEPLIEASARPETIRNIVREINTSMNDHDHPWSQNDVPLLVLSLLMHSPGMKEIPPEWRWHTLGGEVTSPYFALPAKAKSSAKIMGVNSVSELYATDASGTSLLLPTERVSFVRDAGEIYTAAPTLRPVAVTLSRFLKGYAESCRSTPMHQPSPSSSSSSSP
jgi:hypothetical protein